MPSRQALLPASVLLLLASTFAAAQTYDPLGSAPTCAQQCPALISVQSQCANADSVTGNAYCFCTQDNIATFATTPSVCPGCASSSDPQAGSQWFSAFCANPATVTVEPAAATSAPASSATPASATTTTSLQPVATTTGYIPTSSGTTTTDGDGTAAATGTWWQQHGRWIIMVAVLAAAFAVLILVGVFLKRRYQRKRNAADLLPPGTPWGPTQQQQYGQQGPREYYGGAMANEKRPYSRSRPM